MKTLATIALCIASAATHAAGAAQGRHTDRVVAKTDNTYCMMWTATQQSDAGALGRWQRLASGAK